MAWRGRKNPNILAGATWDQDPTFKPHDQPTALFPPLDDFPAPRALTRDDKRIVQNGKALRKAIHQGPLYTESKRTNPFEPKKLWDDEQRNAAYGARSAKGQIDPFENGVPTYSLKYTRVKRTIPQLSGRPFNKELFPPELHDTLEGKTSSTQQRPTRKKLLLALTPAQQAAEEQRRKERFDRLEAEEGEEGDEKAVKEDEDNLPEPDEQDDDYEEDEEDMGGDYDAEQYFDGGDDEDDDLDGGGGDDY